MNIQNLRILKGYWGFKLVDTCEYDKIAVVCLELYGNF